MYRHTPSDMKMKSLMRCLSGCKDLLLNEKGEV